MEFTRVASRTSTRPSEADNDIGLPARCRVNFGLLEIDWSSKRSAQITLKAIDVSGSVGLHASNLPWRASSRRHTKIEPHLVPADYSSPDRSTAREPTGKDRHQSWLISTCEPCFRFTAQHLKCQATIPGNFRIFRSEFLVSQIICALQLQPLRCDYRVGDGPSPDRNWLYAMLPRGSAEIEFAFSRVNNRLIKLSGPEKQST